jgi:hypothetical protein
MTTAQQTALRLALAALEANHQHHMEYDEYNGYPKSDLCEMIVEAIKACQQALAEPQDASDARIFELEKHLSTSSHSHAEAHLMFELAKLTRYERPEFATAWAKRALSIFSSSNNHDQIWQVKNEFRGLMDAGEPQAQGGFHAAHSAGLASGALGHTKAAWSTHAKAAPPASAQAWQPIESAPKDGSSYLVWAGGVGMAHYVDCYQSGYPHKGPFSENLSAWKSMATHWMPLPAAPEATK